MRPISISFDTARNIDSARWRGVAAHFPPLRAQNGFSFAYDPASLNAHQQWGHLKGVPLARAPLVGRAAKTSQHDTVQPIRISCTSRLRAQPLRFSSFGATRADFAILVSISEAPMFTQDFAEWASTHTLLVEKRSLGRSAKFFSTLTTLGPNSRLPFLRIFRVKPQGLYPMVYIFKGRHTPG